jgi:hypothetical protein
MSRFGTFRKYAELLQRRDKRTYLWSAQRYTLAPGGSRAKFRLSALNGHLHNRAQRQCVTRSSPAWRPVLLTPLHQWVEYGGLFEGPQ